MPFTFSPADVAYLDSAAGARALAAADRRALDDASLLADLTALQAECGSFSAAVVETVRLRRRAVVKFGPVAAQWLFTDEALQQAPPAAVARHRADRLAGRAVPDLTCSIGADLAALAGATAVAVGSDLDPVRLAMATHNLERSGLPVRLIRADARTRVTRGLQGYADPARRTLTGRRITSVDTVPSVAELDRAHPAGPPVLRLPPGIDYETLNRPGEVEIVSLDGSAREAVLWPAVLATVDRRATVLRTGGPQTWTSEDPDDIPPPAVAAPGEWLVDPDPAVVRAHLVRAYAAAYGLTQLDVHLAYLAGPLPPPLTRAFLVADVARFSLAVVEAWIRRDGVGTLEIKQRGTTVIPDELRLRVRTALGPDRTRARTLLIARLDQGWTAFWTTAFDPRGAG